MKEIAVVINNVNQNTTPKETMKTIKEAGFQNVFIQWYDEKIEFNQEKQAQYCKELNLNIVFAHLGYQNINNIWLNGKEGDTLVERYRQNIKDCKKYNIPIVVMHLTSGYQAPIYNEIGLGRIQKIVDYADELGIKVAFENLKIKGYLEYVLEHIKNKNVGICYDAGHAHVHFKDDFPFEKFKNRIFAVHLHDNDQTDDLHQIPFDGTINWVTVMEKLKENGYEGPITLELCYRYEYLKMSLLEFYQKGFKVGNKLKKIMTKGEINERK